MTLPDERYRSLIQTKKFLMELLNPHMTPKVPKAIRNRAEGLLRHWPDNYILEIMCEEMPDYFAKEMEPVFRMIKKYEQSKENSNE